MRSLCFDTPGVCNLGNICFSLLIHILFRTPRICRFSIHFFPPRNLVFLSTISITGQVEVGDVLPLLCLLFQVHPFLPFRSRMPHCKPGAKDVVSRSLGLSPRPGDRPASAGIAHPCIAVAPPLASFPGRDTWNIHTPAPQSFLLFLLALQIPANPCHLAPSLLRQYLSLC